MPSYMWGAFQHLYGPRAQLAGNVIRQVSTTRREIKYIVEIEATDKALMKRVDIGSRMTAITPLSRLILTANLDREIRD
jgi:hypothetical protein